MPCSTDMFSKRGSVLMEFVVVLPLYLLFMGSVFVVGEMAMKAIHLSSADRARCHEAGDSDWSSGVFTASRTLQFVEGFVDAVSGGGIYRVADTGIAGPFSQLVSGKATDRYSLPVWTRGWLQYPARVAGIVDTWGQVKPIVSKDVSDHVRAYNFYTLMRVPKSRGRGYRAWSAKELSGLDGKWSDVYGEEYANADANRLDRSGGADGQDPRSEPNKKDEYHRFDWFVDWSE